MRSFPIKKAFFALYFLFICCLPATTRAKVVHHIQIAGVINPITAQFIIETIEHAEDVGAEAVLIELDTPGGLLESTRDITQKFLVAEVPVIVYVSPAGARAGSAGTFITMAAHIAAMAPGSNIGAAHPVTVGGGGMPGGGEPDSAQQSVMTDKMTNDAVAMIRSIADARGRNVEWAEKAVRESDAITAIDALNNQVIDLIAPDIDSLLTAINGRTVTLGEVEHTVNTHGAIIRSWEMTWREKVLYRLSDPNIAYIFMMLGMYGLMFELYNPGAVLPGVVGGICLLLAFMAFQTLPVNLVGLLLILFGIILFILEVKVISYGILTIGGVTSLLLGSLMLIDTEVPELKVSLGVILPSVIATAAFAIFALGMALRAQTRKVTTGIEGLKGLIGESFEDFSPTGQVFINGEYWRAEARVPVKKGDKVKVLELRGMMLIVEPCQPE